MLHSMLSKICFGVIFAFTLGFSNCALAYVELGPDGTLIYPTPGPDGITPELAKSPTGKTGIKGNMGNQLKWKANYRTLVEKNKALYYRVLFLEKNKGGRFAPIEKAKGNEVGFFAKAAPAKANIFTNAVGLKAGLLGIKCGGMQNIQKATFKMAK